ncbi:MAG TPA: hypothetical protein VGH89_13305 [Pseudonocardia sp.]|jgi:hypothetical protein
MSSPPSPRRPDPSNAALARRLDAVEARLRDLEDPYAETMYQLRRGMVRNEMRMTRVLEHLGIADVSDDQVDQALDEQS